MKKIFSITLIVAVAVMLSACGKQSYTPWTPTTPVAPQGAEAVDPITKFNTVWESDNYPSALDFNDTQKRTLSNFFGFSEAHKALSNLCPLGFKNTTTNTCFSSTEIQRNYFTALDTSYKPYPSAKDFGTVTSYKIRFAVNVNTSTGELTPGDAYLDIDLKTSSDSFNVKFSVVKVPLTVNSSTGVATVTFEDECGDVTFSATVNPVVGVVTSVTGAKITFLNTPESYKKASCYHDGKLPTLISNNTMAIYPSTAPEGIHTDAGRGTLFIKTGTCPSNPTTLISSFHKE